MTKGRGVKLAFSAEQDLFRTTVRRFLEQHSPEAEVRRGTELPDGFDRTLWTRAAEALGLPGLVVPERFGGSGSTVRDLAVVLEETGRALFCSPLLPTALAATALLRSTDEKAQAAHLPGIADGSIVATITLPDPAPTVRLVDGRLSGTADPVLYGDIAGLVLVFADTGAGTTLCAVDPSLPGVTRIPLRPMDLTRRFARIGFEDVAVSPIGTGPEVVGEVVDLAALLFAAEACGGAGRVLEMAVGYAGTRTQFGRAIGSFQAVKHRCADMLLEVEAARSTVQYAALAAAELSADRSVSAWLAKYRCSQAFLRVSEDNILLHGGIGFTWEHPAHLYYRRARSDATHFGDVTRCRERLRTGVGLEV